MSDRFQTREFILRATQKWPVLVVFCLVGSLSGWLISLLLPSTIHATTELYVGLNVGDFQSAEPSTTTLQPQFENADDYKNWQMANLNSLVFMDEILDETLSALQGMDGFWNGINRNQLRKSLNVYWRNAGKWRLVAKGEDRLRTGQAVTAWQNVIVERVHLAVANSESLQSTVHEIEGLSVVLAQITAREGKLNFFSDTFHTRLDFLSTHAPAEPLNVSERWSLWQPIAQAELGVIWKSLSETFPAESAPYLEYAVWIDQAIQGIELEKQALAAQKEQLDIDRAELIKQYSEATISSMGLSKDLEVEKITSDVPQFNVIRPTSTLVLIGMFIGFISWIGYWLLVFSQAGRR